MSETRKAAVQLGTIRRLHATHGVARPTDQAWTGRQGIRMSIATGRRLCAGVRSVLAAVGLVAALVGCGGGAARNAPASIPAFPSSMDALGASTTRGYNDCPTPWIDCPDNSWSTGRNATINSIYLRLLSL